MIINGKKIIFSGPKEIHDIPSAVLSKKFAILDIGLDNQNGEKALAWLEENKENLRVMIDHHRTKFDVTDISSDIYILPRDECPACPSAVSRILSDNSDIYDNVKIVIAHTDFDGIISLATFLLNGQEPYPGAFNDADIIDTERHRFVELTPTGRIVYDAVKGGGVFAKFDILSWLIYKDDISYELIKFHAEQYIPVIEYSMELVELAYHEDNVIILEVPILTGRNYRRYDSSLILTEMCKRNEYAVMIWTTFDGTDLTTVSTNKNTPLVDELKLDGGLDCLVTLNFDRMHPDDIIHHLKSIKDVYPLREHFKNTRECKNDTVKC